MKSSMQTSSDKVLFYMSAELPSTHDAVGFSDIVYTLLGSGRGADKDSKTPINPLTNGMKISPHLRKFPYGIQTFKMGWNVTNPGEQMILAAKQNYDLHSFKVIFPDGAKYCFTARVYDFLGDSGGLHWNLILNTPREIVKL